MVDRHFTISPTPNRCTRRAVICRNAAGRDAAMSVQRGSQRHTIDDALRWRENMAEALRVHRAAALDALHRGAFAASSRFFGLTRDEIETDLNADREELDAM